MFHGGESGRKTEYDNILVLERIVVQFKRKVMVAVDDDDDF